MTTEIFQFVNGIDAIYSFLWYIYLIFLYWSFLCNIQHLFQSEKIGFLGKNCKFNLVIDMMQTRKYKKIKWNRNHAVNSFPWRKMRMSEITVLQYLSYCVPVVLQVR